MEEQFRRGLIKAARKTEMWFITNGIDGGISAMVGTAFGEEKASRSETTANDSGSYYSDESDTPLTLIGILSASTLQNWSSFDGSQLCVIPAIGSKSDGKSYKFDMNPDHTHAVIYDDYAQQNSMANQNEATMANEENSPPSYNQFRDQVESLLTRSLSFYKRKDIKIGL
jgi:hypothetical protein